MQHIIISRACVGNRKIQIEVIYRKRKTMEIQVIPPGKVRVVVPQGAPDQFILESLQKKASWILEKLAEVRAKEERIPKHQFLDGEVFLFLGQEFVLKILFNEEIRKPQVHLEECASSLGSLFVEASVVDKSTIKDAIEKWYKKKAKEIITARINYYGEKMGRKPVNVRLSNAKKRWGSCTSGGTILINWRMVMAPLWVLDYLVVHEMSHLFHLNHAKSFWRLVAKVMPDFKKGQDWLRANGYGLTL